MNEYKETFTNKEVRHVLIWFGCLLGGTGFAVGYLLGMCP